jgi:hypothetical protein
MARDPFEYLGDCTGPDVDLDIVPSGFPICSFPSFRDPTFCPNLLDPTKPEIAPPPMCPCIPTMYLTPDSTIAVTGTLEPFMTFLVRPGTDDCCEPTFEATMEIFIPCVGFDLEVIASINTGIVSADVSIGTADCEVGINIGISLPTFGSGLTGPTGPTGPVGSGGTGGSCCNCDIIFTQLGGITCVGPDASCVGGEIRLESITGTDGNGCIKEILIILDVDIRIPLPSGFECCETSPTCEPTLIPTYQPTYEPTNGTYEPTSVPTNIPTCFPTGTLPADCKDGIIIRIGLEDYIAIDDHTYMVGDMLEVIYCDGVPTDELPQTITILEITQTWIRTSPAIGGAYIGAAIGVCTPSVSP